MRNYVIINGVNSLTIQGLAIKTLPPITKPIQRTLREEIDGRDGDLVTELGYGAYDKTIEIGLFGTFDIDEVIAYFNQKGTITFSNEADKVYYFEALDQVDYAELLKFRTANVVLHCQPFKYPINETPLVEEYEYVEATGTNVTMNNTSEAIFNKIDLIGNTEQTQYTGKNKLDQSRYITTRTTNGITYTNNGDGTFNLTGTATSNTSINIITGNILETNKNYYLYSSVPYDISTFNMSIPFKQDGVQKYLTANHSISTSGVIAEERLAFYIASGLSINLQNIKLMLVETLTADNDYEPYVGGIPSPNPNYPQDIHVVSGDNTIEIRGTSNLESADTLYERMHNFNSSNVSEVTDGDIEAIRLNPRYYRPYGVNPAFNCYTGWKPNTQYTIRAIAKRESGGSQFYLQIAYTDGTQTNTQIIYNDNEYHEIRIVSTAGKTIMNAGFSYGNDGIWLIDKSSWYIGEGNVTTYEPYEGETYLLNLGVENLAQYKNGYIVTATGVFKSSNDDCFYFPVIQGETYYCQSTGNRTIGAIYTSVPIAEQTCIQGTNINNVPKNGSFVASATGIMVVYANTPSSQSVIDTFKITKGSTPQTISDNPIEMASIPNTNYKDTFVKEGETWYKREAVGKIILTGSEAWQVANTGTANWIYLTYLANFKPITTGGVANYYPYVTIGGSDTNQGIFAVTDYVRIRWGTEDTIANYKTWLSTHNLILYWIKTTPTDIEITNETLIDQLEAIKNAISYKGQTNISQTNNDMPFILDLSALKENSDHLVIDNIGNIYSKPTLDLEGTGIVDIYLNDSQMFEVDLSEKNEIVIDTEKNGSIQSY